MHIKLSYTIAAAAIAVGLTCGTFTPASAADGNPRVLPANAHAYGQSYGEWSADWWKWALSLPPSSNPFFDENGSCTNGANGQHGPVWFLTGVINASGTATRNCTVPTGKALFFPVMNNECSTVEAPPAYGYDEPSLQACSKILNIVNMFAEIDGVKVENLENYLVMSPLYTFNLPAENVLGLPPGSGESVANGYYLLLPPLPPGEHIVHFGGTNTDYGFSLDITYHLTVQPGR